MHKRTRKCDTTLYRGPSWVVATITLGEISLAHTYPETSRVQSSNIIPWENRFRFKADVGGKKSRSFEGGQGRWTRRGTRTQQGPAGSAAAHHKGTGHPPPAARVPTHETKLTTG